METTESIYLPQANRKDAGYYSIVFIFLSTALQSCFGFARDAPPVFKLLIAALCWLSCMFAIGNIRTWSSYPQFVRFLFVLLFVDVVGSFVHAIWLGEVYAGNKYVVLMTNMSATLNIISVFLVFAITNYGHLCVLLRCTLLLFFLNALLLVFNFRVSTYSYFLSYFMIYSAIFLPYISKQKKIMFMTGVIMAMFAFWGGGRQVIVSLGFMLMAWIVPKFISKKMVLVLSLLLIISPIFYIWFYGDNYGDIFWRMQANVENQEQLSGNTRTFLYQEVMEDFQRRDYFTQIFGQGTLAYYDSDFFKNDSRFAVEVPILQWIMQCGIIFYILLTILCIVAVCFIFIHGQSRLMSTISILLGAFYFMCHVSNFTGCNTMHLGFWGMMGMAFNSMFLNATDDTIIDELG